MSSVSTSRRSASGVACGASQSASTSLSAVRYSRLVRIGRSSMFVTSYSSGIDLVVLAMGADEPDEHHAPVVMHGSDETVVVALDIKDNAVIRDEACRAVSGPDIGRPTPIGATGVRVPRPQRDFCIGVSVPKIPQSAPCDDPHCGTLPCSHHGSKGGICRAVNGEPRFAA